MAKMVRSMKVLKMEAGSLTGADLKLGTSGKLSRSTPAMRKFDRSHLTVAQLFSSLRKLTGASGSTRTISKSLRAPTHIEPGVLISASVSQRSVTSRRSEEHTSELQSRQYLVCRLLLEKKYESKIVRFCSVHIRTPL